LLMTKRDERVLGGHVSLAMRQKLEGAGKKTAPQWGCFVENNAADSGCCQERRGGKGCILSEVRWVREGSGRERKEPVGCLSK
jgi:hypothetical protein